MTPLSYSLYLFLISSQPTSLLFILYFLFVIPSILIITAKFPPAICGVGDHSAGLRNWLQQKGHRVIVANGIAENLQQGVYRYPEKGRADFFATLVQKESITHVLWQYSPYAMHAQGTPWWVLGAMRALRKMDVKQAVYFHEIQIRYSVPGWYNKLRAFQQHAIANRAVSICKRTGTSIDFYLRYLTAEIQSNSAKKIRNISALSEENLRLSAVKKNTSLGNRFLKYITAKRQSAGAKDAKNTANDIALSAENLRLSAVKKNTRLGNRFLKYITAKKQSTGAKDAKNTANDIALFAENLRLPAVKKNTSLGNRFLKYITAKRQSAGAKDAKNTANDIALSAENLRLSAVNCIHLIPVPPNIPVDNIKMGSYPGADVIRVGAFSNRAIPGIIDALARIQKRLPTIEVVWLGHASDTDMDALRKNMDHYGLNARITGAVPLELLAREIEQLNVILLPQPLGANNEGGISLKNGTLSAALAATLPIIATRGDMTDTGLLKHGNNIHLLGNNEAASWQQAIEHMLQDADYSARISRAGYVFYTEHLSWEVVGNAFEDLLGL